MKKTVMLAAIAVLLLPGILLAQSTATGRARPAAATYTLTVNADVKGATVYVGKESKGTAPYSEKLTAGTYEIRVAARDYKDFTVTVELNKDTTINARLEAILLDLKVDADVRGATVYVGKDYKGTVPYSGKVGPGTYEIRVAARDYKDYTTTVSVTRDTTINAKLEPVLFDLTVITNVQKARIFVNKADRGVTGPDKSRKEDSLVLRLGPGTYELVVRAPGWQDYVAQVTLNRDLTVEAMLKPSVATVSLPEKYLEGNAKVFKLYIDGKLVNAQLAVKGAIEVPPGKHTVAIASAPAGLRVEREFDFAPGANYVIELILNFVLAIE